MEKDIYTILLVDDESDVLEFLSYNLIKEGYRVLTARNGKDGLEVLKDNHPDLIILDVMMPGMDGIETCKIIRSMPSFKDTIVIFLTARGEDYSQLAGFEAGADDYVTKPIKPKILTSRVKALLRRLQPATNHQNSLQDISIDKERYLVVKQGKEIILPRKEFELLALLTSKPNKVFTREEIYTKVWGDDVVVGDRTIDVHVRRIREKIGIDNIKTVKGVGYKYEELV
ncbi:MAG: response regulator transcription factor [Omnitrophica WOR_2 bacterium]|jgi:two-component system alkaline phosphatase synthesis response regulator PhoP